MTQYKDDKRKSYFKVEKGYHRYILLSMNTVHFSLLHQETQHLTKKSYLDVQFL